MCERLTLTCECDYPVNDLAVNNKQPAAAPLAVRNSFRIIREIDAGGTTVFLEQNARALARM